MNSTHHTGEINYYDEIGVEANATPEEIREAYRALVRMLHPDQQTDEQLRLIAERQLRKLNAVYAVLSDPEQRRVYDEDLADGYGQPIIVNGIPPDGPRRRFAAPVVWVAAILLGAGLLWWLASDNASAPPSRGRDPVGSFATESTGPAKTTASRTDQAAAIQRLQADLRVVAQQRDEAQRELEELRASVTAKSERKPYQPPAILLAQHAETTLAISAAPPAIPSGAVAGTTKFPISSPAPPAPARAHVELPAPRVESASRSRRLAGFWFYARPESNQAKTRGDYAPEFIEATITEENGVIHGNYRSRFRIVDRPISPDVNFTFSGAANGTLLKCPWIGPGGAKGELTLQLLSDTTIRLDWLASELGSQQGLLSGTAVLTRKVD